MSLNEPSSPRSKWNFKPVMDALVSPDKGDRQRSPCGQIDARINWSPRQHANSAHSPYSYPTTKHIDPELGDVSGLWFALDEKPAVPWNVPLPDSLEESSFDQPNPLNQPCSHQPRSSIQPNPLPKRVGTVLKRDYHDHTPQRSKMGVLQSAPNPSLPQIPPQQAGDKATGSLASPPQSHPIPIPGTGHTNNTPAIKNKKSSRVNATLSESGTEADSESNTNLFDRRIPRLAFVPTQLGKVDTQVDHLPTPPTSLDEQECFLNNEPFPHIRHTPQGIQVLPAGYKDSSARLVGLMTKLIHQFPQYVQLLSQVGHLAPENTASPIHVFVDMSNITAGFHESVKVSRNIPVSTWIRRLHMSFFNFSLILERGRPALKRVLVGSDRLRSIYEAEELGYEANILDRVKVKQTPRPSKFQKGPGSQLASSGPEMAGATGNRWVEQGVDEILHLKMLESLLDTGVPATIVLATGDAAEAEYSGGFMRMVERALSRGWSVELVSFSRVTSKAYHRKEFREKWGRRFSIIDLDYYLEELFE